MEGVVAEVISKLIARGVEKIASRKKLTSQDLTVLLLHEQSRAIAGLEKGMARMEKGMDTIANELGLLRREIVPLLNQARDVADIKARMERIEAKIG